jgi:hypothetical protein
MSENRIVDNVFSSRVLNTTSNSFFQKKHRGQLYETLDDQKGKIQFVCESMQ